LHQAPNRYRQAVRAGSENEMVLKMSLNDKAKNYIFVKNIEQEKIWLKRINQKD
jgi:hypothetical protein